MIFYIGNSLKNTPALHYRLNLFLTVARQQYTMIENVVWFRLALKLPLTNFLKSGEGTPYVARKVTQEVRLYRLVGRNLT